MLSEPGPSEALGRSIGVRQACPEARDEEAMAPIGFRDDGRAREKAEKVFKEWPLDDTCTLRNVQRPKFLAGKQDGGPKR